VRNLFVTCLQSFLYTASTSNLHRLLLLTLLRTLVHAHQHPSCSFRFGSFLWALLSPTRQGPLSTANPLMMHFLLSFLIHFLSASELCSAGRTVWAGKCGRGCRQLGSVSNPVWREHANRFQNIGKLLVQCEALHLSYQIRSSIDVLGFLETQKSKSLN
jgi:hypothetical protein